VTTESTAHAVAAAMADAARDIAGSPSLEETLDAIAQSARASVPGFDHAGISTIDRKGRITTRAATDDIVLALDDLQYSLDEGPCVDALRREPFVVVPYIQHEQRWPRYVAEAARTTGLKAQLAVQLFLDEGTLGGLNLYSTEQETIDDEALEIARFFAAHASVALGKAQTIEGLQAALEARKQIGQALGILMERHRVNEDRAFAFLARVSSHSNVKLRDVAAQLVDEANQR
jgi:GAF domain-containing protein